MLPEYLFQEGKKLIAVLLKWGTFRWCSLLSPLSLLPNWSVCTHTHICSLPRMHSLSLSPGGEGDTCTFGSPHPLFRKCFQDTWVYCQLYWAGRAQETPTLQPLSFRVEVGRQPGCKVLGLSPSSLLKKAMRSCKLLIREEKRGQEEVTQCL